MRLLTRAAGAGAAAAVALGLACASSAPMTANPSPDAMLRLAWSARPERIERCRRQTEEELAALPRHMRQEVVCAGTTAEYRLQVRLDGEVVADQIVHGGGLRRDRRVYVFREVVVTPGDRAVDVRFERLDPDVAPGAPGSENAPPSGTHPAAASDPTLGDVLPRVPAAAGGEGVPPRLALQRRLRFVPREVTLVTFDPERRELIAVQHDNGRR